MPSPRPRKPNNRGWRKRASLRYACDSDWFVSIALVYIRCDSSVLEVFGSFRLVYFISFRKLLVCASFKAKNRNITPGQEVGVPFHTPAVFVLCGASASR